MEEKPLIIKLILSSKAANKLQKTVERRTELESDLNTWRIDLLSLRRRGIFLITNEKTLYTYISPVKEGSEGILRKVSGGRITEERKTHEINYIKYQNRNVIGSMTDMKNLLKQIDQYTSIEDKKAEELLNNTPFKYLSYRHPSEVHSERQP